MRLYVALLAVGLASPALSADPPAGRVRLPLAPSVPSPMPNPEASITLTPELVMVCDSDIDCVVVCSPKGRLKITPAKGPITVRGKFVDGTGQVEMRTFAGPFVWFIEAAEAGECELLVLPVGSKESDLLRRRIVSQTGPQPPPKPKPDDPIPDPKPKPPKPVESFRVIFVWESGTTPTAGQLGVSDSVAVRDYLDRKTTKEGGHPGWRKYDPQQQLSGEQPTMTALWNAAKPKITTVPCLIVEVNGKADILPYPANAAESLALLKKYGGE